MGIDVHNLNFLAHAQSLGARYTRCLAVGRQGVHAESEALARLAQWRGLPPLQGDAASLRWFEPMLQQWFGARETESVDASPYEGATHVHDLNQPWPQPPAPYDAVLDFGCLEHVFDFPTAWRTLVELTAPGGHLLHALPANNLCGHGFYQFSPELFFNLYRRERGFALKGVWCALRSDARHWWRVADPQQLRRRVNLRNGQEVYLLVLAQRLPEPLPPFAVPQQSDYAAGDWVGAQTQPAAQVHPLSGLLRSTGLLPWARRQRERWQGLRASGLALPAPDFERVSVEALLRQGARA